MKTPMIARCPDPLEIASEWFLHAEAGLEARDVARLDAWLAADPAHRAAYDAVLEANEALERLDGEEAVFDLRRTALKTRRDRGRAPAVIAAGLAAALIVAGGGWWVVAGGPTLSPRTTAPSAERYVTAAGERATVTLADGSTLVLNTDSAAEVVFDRQERRVHLVKGQALFTVAHDPARPFQVLVGDRRVTALGTVFDVLLVQEDLRVAMLQGVVRVSAAPPPPPGPAQASQILSVGEAMTVRADGSVTIRKMDTERLAGWKDGIVYFEDTPLGEAAAEMSRYTRAPVAVADSRAGALRVSGVFRTSEAETFAGTMSDLFSLRIRRSADGTIILGSGPL